jgi:hypothetical protein
LARTGYPLEGASRTTCSQVARAQPRPMDAVEVPMYDLIKQDKETRCQELQQNARPPEGADPASHFGRHVPLEADAAICQRPQENRQARRVPRTLRRLDASRFMLPCPLQRLNLSVLEVVVVSNCRTNYIQGAFPMSVAKVGDLASSPTSFDDAGEDRPAWAHRTLMNFSRPGSRART